MRIFDRYFACLMMALIVATKVLVNASTSTISPRKTATQRDREGESASSASASSASISFNQSNKSEDDQDRGWPLWFPRDFSNTKSRGPKSDRDRGWPLWFPRNFNNNISRKSNNSTELAASEPPLLLLSSNNTKNKDGRSGVVDVTSNKTAAVDTSSSPSAPSIKDREEKASTNSTSTARTPPLFFRRQRQQQSEILIIVNNSNNETSYDVKKNETTTELTTTSEATPPPTKDEENLKNESGREGIAIDTPNDTPTVNNTNNTTSEPDVSQQSPPSTTTSSSPQLLQQQGPGVIVLSSPNAPYRIYRRPGSAGPGLSGIGGPVVEPFPSSPGRGTGGVPQTTNNGVLLVELAASVLGTLTRLWLLRSITSWLAKQEESMQPTQHFVWESLNDKYVRDSAALKTAVQAPPNGVAASRWKRIQNRRQGRPPRQILDLTSMFQRTVIVVELTSESKDGPDNAYLSDIISFLVQQHRRHAFGTNKTTLEPAELEVVFLVQSPGGTVSSFGLAAAQLQRLAREKGIATTVCVDKYAASGGYMIASQAHRLIAAPFASVGSIGVIMEGLNFNEIARKYGVQPLVIKAGDSKNPITTFGAISRQDLDQQKEQLDKVHDSFKELILQGRPCLKDTLGKVADGNVFLGQEALELQLVDSVMTSSEYLLERVEEGDRVLKLHRSSPSRFHRRVNVSPLDILPHLRRSLHLVTSGMQKEKLSSWFVQGVSYLGILHHFYTKYCR